MLIAGIWLLPESPEISEVERTFEVLPSDLNHRGNEHFSNPTYYVSQQGLDV